MKFQLLDILPHVTNPVTGREVSVAERLNQAVTSAKYAEQFGLDAVAIGERHAGKVISAGVTVVLGAIAAQTSRIRIGSGVTVLSILDPVRVAEDYATLDQLSRGRVEITIGKGNELKQLPMFGIAEGTQWDTMAENYALLHRLFREENVTWSGTTRPSFEGLTTLPRPYAGPPRVWHGSATTLTSAELAAEYGDPIISANAIQPRDNYTRLLDHYKEKYLEHGHDPAKQLIGAGAGFLYLADTTQEAKDAFGPTYEAMVAYHSQPGNHTPGNEMTFKDIDAAVERGPVLVGSPAQIAEKILWWHEAFGHQLQSFSLPTMIPHEQQLEMLERFAAEVVPVVRAAAPSRLWEPGQDAYATRPAFAGGVLDEHPDV